MDLSNLKPTTSELAIKDPATDQPTGLVIELRYVNDDKYEQHSYERVMAEAEGGEAPSYSQYKRRRIDQIAGACVGWRWEGDASFGGEKLEFGTENLRKVLAVNEIRDQVEKRLNDKKRFFPG
ncbi:hypothetical protein GCM10011348_45780 [Marinobacterium nitratireducens]|uniref:Uncharacterized protein n=1 Tax=Marinobacterium nitratireducens TaxID=518897 RepID=A0A917ZPR4_9GAMM|nr:hypothetical protein [Marinobacterium nitratireducens]GGO89016.1 hypothetical protein GCM10011348_45780 [Marinobacterium nitratireducens]